MEAKVDVRKLQMLNDRIIQTLEALTQVRASVHGIGQTNPYSAYGQPSMPGPYGQLSPYSQQPSPYGQVTLGHSPVPPYAPYPTPFNGLGQQPIGLSHSSHPQQSPFVPGLSPWQSVAPLSPYPYPPQPYAPVHYAQPQWSPFAPMGLSHTGIDDMERRMVEQRASDIGRLMQTFPYGAYV